MKTKDGHIEGTFNALTGRGELVKNPYVVVECPELFSGKQGTFRFNDIIDGMPWKAGVTVRDLDDWMEDPPEGELTIWAVDNDGDLRKYEMTLQEFYTPGGNLEDYRCTS